MQHNYLIRTCFLLALSLLSLSAVYAKTITVTSAMDSGNGTLRQAVFTAVDGDDIVFAVSLNGTPIVLNGQIFVTKSISITGNGQGSTLISGGLVNRVFEVRKSSTVSITGLTLYDGITKLVGGAVRVRVGSTLRLMRVTIKDSESTGPMANMGGGGISNAGTLSMEQCTVSNNVASGASGSGGGILNRPGGVLTLVGTNVSSNTANRAGGGIEDASGGLLTLTNCTIDGNIVNTSPGNGGGIHIGNEGSLTVSGGSISNNTAGSEGGGIWIGFLGELMLGNKLQIRQNVAMGNDADQGGGGVYCDGDNLLDITGGVMITRNKATGTSGSGGGILASPGTNIFISGSHLIANEANRAGGGIEDASGGGSDFVIDKSNIDRNVVRTMPGNGGGIHVARGGELILNRSTVNGNRAGAEGGGVWTGSGRIAISGTEISGNLAAGDEAGQGGGGVYNDGGGQIELSGVTITKNAATGTLGGGGGIANQGGARLNIGGSMIAENRATAQGGGIKDITVDPDNTETFISNSRIVKNVASDTAGCGGGIYFGSGRQVELTGGSISGNRAGASGGGIWNGTTAFLFIDATLIRNNEAMGDDPDQGGGGVYNEGALVMGDKGRVAFNRATGTSGSGGGILNNKGGTLSLEGTMIEGNEANRAGGGIEDASGSSTDVTLTDVRLEGNRVNNAPGNGGGLHVGSDGNVTMIGGTVIRNTAGQEGGGLWNGLGTMTVSNVAVQGNRAEGDQSDNGGGGIYNDGGDVLLDAVTVRDNHATGVSGSGGGLLSTDGTIIIEGGLFTRNTANRAGGGVEVVDGSFASFDARYSRNNAGSNPGNGGAFHVSGQFSTVFFFGGAANYNTAANEGGALWNQAGSMMIVEGMSIYYNTVTDAGTVDTRVGGGGVFNNGGTLDMIASTVAYNTATGGELTGGGGIANNTGGTILLDRSTISNNAAGLAGGGIGNDGIMEIRNTTITRNMAPNGGGFAQARDTASLIIIGSIIADNEADRAPDFGTLEGTVVSLGFNLIGNDDENQFPATDTDIEGQRADLMALADNGGMTKTHAPNCGSPAIDAGDPMDEDPDQIGQEVFGESRDIGSFEKQSSCGDPVLPAIAGRNQSVRPASESLSAFPNPISSNERLTVRMPERFSGEVTLRVISANGKVLRVGTVSNGTQRLDLSGFAPGAYTLQAMNGEENETVRFVITR